MHGMKLKLPQAFGTGMLRLLRFLILLIGLSPLAGFAQTSVYSPSGDGKAPFPTKTQWHRVDPSGQAPAELRMLHSTGKHFTFELDASAGANSGAISGEARRVGSTATLYRYRYRRQASSDSANACVLTFSYLKREIVIAQSGNAAACGAGNGVRFSGTYVAGDKDPNIKPDLLSLGVFSSQRADAAFRTLVGADYAKFVATADVIDSSSGTIDNQPVTIVNLFARGVACNTKAMILFDEHGRQWAALWDPAAVGPVTLRYYTNIDADQQTLPSEIAAHKAACTGDEVRVQMP